MTRVKICGITRREDAEVAIELGAHALGFILEPTSKRYLREVPAWIEILPPYVAKVAVFGNMPADFDDPRFDAVQASAESLPLDSRFDNIAAVRCKADDSVQSILAKSECAGAIHLDAFVEGNYGGTGRCIDWALAAEIVRASPKPVILAGGLTPENVAEAIRRVKPYAVDLSSGVEESPGIKDPVKLKHFFEAVRMA